MKPIAPLQTWLVEHDPLRVVPLTDSVIDRVGVSVADPYVETYWLPILGPSALWALRRIGGWLTECPDGFDMPHLRLAAELGLGHRDGRQSPMIRTLARLVMFDMAAITANDELAVRRFVPPLPRRFTLRLPGHLAARHEAEVAEVARQASGVRR